MGDIINDIDNELDTEVDADEDVYNADVVSGVDIESRSYSWRIKNFSAVMGDDTLIAAQQFHFHAGETVNQSSKWRVSLGCTEDGPNWIGIFFEVIKRPQPANRCLHAECSFAVRTKDGNELYRKGTGIINWECKEDEWIFPKFIHKGAPPPYTDDGSLLICCDFKIYSTPDPERSDDSIQQLLANFNERSKSKAWNELQGLLASPMSSKSVIKIIASDGKVHRARREVLSARSPVFYQLFKNESKEKSAGELQLADMCSESVEVLLRYLQAGELLPSWKDSEVLVELTNAAAKFHLLELLGFLDTAVGKVCVVENVAELINLAGQYKLETAEKELLQFVSKEGFRSADNFLQILRAVAESEKPRGNRCSIC